MLADDRLRHEPISLERARRLAACRVGVTALGDALRQRGSLDDAIHEYRRVLAADPLPESVRISPG